ncbi:MAG: GNAT family acetyltransferase [Sphingomonadales bacterium]
MGDRPGALTLTGADAMVTGMAEVTIRPMEDRDRAGVVRLWQACALTRPWNDPDRDLTMAMESTDATLFVAEQGGAVIGSVMTGFDGHRGWIYYLAVAPDWQREGLGRRLFAAAEAWLKQRGAPKIQLMVREGNAAAARFYEAIGLEIQPVVTYGRWLRD